MGKPLAGLANKGDCLEGTCLVWRELAAAAVDELVDAACDREEALLVQKSSIACVEPAICTRYAAHTQVTQPRHQFLQLDGP